MLLQADFELADGEETSHIHKNIASNAKFSSPIKLCNIAKYIAKSARVESGN